MDSSPEDEIGDLIAHLEQLLQRGIAEVATVAGPLWVITQVQTVIDMGNGAMQGQTEMRPAISERTLMMADGVVAKHLSAELATTIYSSPLLRRRFLTDAALNEIGEPHRVQWLRNSLTAPFIRRYLQRVQAVSSFDQSAFDLTAAELRTYLDSPTVTVVTSSGLDGFSMDRETLEIRPGLRIEHIGWDERRGLYEQVCSFPAAYSFNEAFDAARTEWVIRQETQVEPKFSLAGGSMDVHFERERLVTALRLYASGSVVYRRHWVTVKEPVFTIGGTSQGGPVSGVRPSVTPMSLTVDDTTGPSLLDLLRHLESENPDPGLAVALRRFDFSYGRPFMEDRLIDLWIGLEALFTTKDERTETTDKIARRIARLVGRNQGARIDLRKEVRELYNERSRVVHGADLGQPERLARATERSAELLRHAIRSRLLEPWTVDGLEALMMQ